MTTIKFSPNEETSIILNGKFNEDTPSKNLKLSLDRSLALETKLPNEIRFMGGMSGKKYRYLINNFISMTENSKYLEIGSWAGSTVCSAIYGNKVKALCIDNWLKFDTEDYLKNIYKTKDQKKEFEENTKKIITKDIDFKFIESDFRKVDYSKLEKFNIYCYDALHDEKSQYDGINIAQPALEDVFFLIIDDWNWVPVRNGTLNAIKDLNIKIISSIEIRTTQDNTMPLFMLGQYSDWHNGYFLAICKK